MNALKPWLTPSQENLQAVIGLLAGCGLVIASAVLVKQSIDVISANPQSTATSEARRNDVAANIVNPAAVTSADLFGEAGQAGLASALPATTLALVLRGVFTGANPQQGQAIIESGEGRSSMFSVDSEVTNGVVLSAVYADRVVLSRSGALETLPFPTPSASATDQDLATLTAGNQRLAAAAALAGSAGASDEASVEERKAMIRQRLEELRNRQQGGSR